MKIKINGVEYDIINAFNSNLYIDNVNRECKQFTLPKSFDLSLFSDDMNAQLIDNEGNIEDLWEYCILGEIHIKRQNIILWLCKKTETELWRELAESYIN